MDIEKWFFGRVDNDGRHATDYFANFAHPSIDDDALHNLLRYMSTQKLRTPKGLAWLLHNSAARSKTELLTFLQQLENLYGAIWCECVWQIGDASDSPTKFIVSDHPVTVYNRDYPPTSLGADGSNDPDIRQHGTHTLFPLSSDKVLMLTNLSWVRNPYQSAWAFRPNPDFLRGAIFNFMDVQTHRHLTETEVIQINYITKRRAFRYIAAAEEEWLYPEQQIAQRAWRELGDDWLLMPDPRSVMFGGKTIFGHHDGTSSAWDEYGFRPWERGFDDRQRSTNEWATFHRFVGEYARRFGPVRRGRAFRVPSLDPERDSDELHQANLRYETEYDRFVGAN